MPLSRITSPFQSSTANVYSPSANTVAIRTSSADRVIVDSNGIVGFGSTTPNITWPFRTVARPTSLGASPIAAWDGTSTPGISFNDNYPGVNFNGMYKYFPSGGTYYMGNGSLATIYLDPTSSAGDVLFSTANTGTANTISTPVERVRFNQFGIGLGGTQPVSGMGIRFPASQVASTNPNTLDDYEEGTWTPTNSLGITTSTSTAHYVKIGLTVYLSLFLNINSNGNGGSFIITGLPFALGDGSASVGCFNNTGTPLYAYMDSNGIFIRDSSNNSRSGGGLSGNFVAFQMTYRATA
jgi:hypothetical protein